MARTHPFVPSSQGLYASVQQRKPDDTGPVKRHPHETLFREDILPVFTHVYSARFLQKSVSFAFPRFEPAHSGGSNMWRNPCPSKRTNDSSCYSDHGMVTAILLFGVACDVLCDNRTI